MKSPTKSKLSPLHTHTSYSVLDGASSIDDYIKFCKQNDLPGLAVTDHGWMIGALEVWGKCKQAGIVGIPGVEFYVTPDTDYEFKGKPYAYYHVTAWAVSEAGYRNLLKLGSLSFKDDKIKILDFLDADKTKIGIVEKSRVISRFGSPKPRITFQELLEHNEGLVLGSGCLIGSINKALLNGEITGAERNLMKLMEVYKGRIFVELMPHICDHDYSREKKNFIQNPCTDFSPDGDLQHACNLKNIEIARKYDMPLIMTIDSHFTTPDKKTLQDCLLQNGDPDGWRFYNSYHMMSTEQAWEHWSARYGSDVQQQKVFCEAVENNDIIVELARGLEIHDPYRLPSPEIPLEIQSSSELNDSEKIKATMFGQIDQIGRMKWDDPVYMDRLQKEIAVICDNGDLDFGPYFMFLWKWNKWTRDHSILSAPGRGSGAGSLLCYVMGITHLDPIRWNLPFERFLSAARIARKKYPDIDWDLGDREPLLAALQEEYGDKFAQCSTHQVLKVKSALKDACRVILGWNSNDSRVNDLCKTIPITPMGVNDRDFLLGYKDQEGNIHNGHLMENTVLDNFLRENPKIQEMLFSLLGIPRAVGRHASAYFISNAPIWESVPTATLNGYTVTQYTTTAANNWAEKAGLVKFDFLRINTLSFISSCIRLVQERAGYKVWKEKKIINNEEFELTLGELPITAIPMSDGRMLDIYDLPIVPDVFKDLTAGKTESVFQLNSALMTGFTIRIKPSSLQELSDIVALVRPGPLEALIEDGKTTMTEAYIARKNGLQKVTYAHPDMEPILKDTFGVAVYQEQLQQMFIDLAGYNSEDADYLREVLAKKKKQEMEKSLPELRQRLKDRGWTDAQQEVFIGLCISSSAYSFNRSHSAAYGSVGYWCAFLKHFFPLEWWTGVLLYAKIDDIKTEYAHCVKEYLEMPHVNGPSDTFELFEGKIHAPLYLIDGIGDVAAKSIKNERENRGAFNSLQNFFERIDKRSVNQTVFHQLIICDAFKKIEPNKSPKELLNEYHYLRKVSSIKLGDGKHGSELAEAILKYKKRESEKGQSLDVPELYASEIDLEVNRLKSMPIYRLDVHNNFRSALEHFGMIVDKDYTTYMPSTDSPRILIFKNTKQIEKIKDRLGKNIFGWVGLVQDSEVFRYTDRKSGKQVAAVKLYIANDGDVIESILWPDMKDRYLSVIKKDRLIFVSGTVKESREPGKWSISIQDLKVL